MRHPLQSCADLRPLLILLSMMYDHPAIWAQGPVAPVAAESILFETPSAVKTAALYTQTLQEAPADVTVISRQQIRTYVLLTALGQRDWGERGARHSRLRPRWRCWWLKTTK